MSALPLVIIPQPSLREPSRELSREEILSPELQKFFIEMIPAMYEYDGIGLAAPQVGQNIRVCIIGKSAIDRSERPEISKPKKNKNSDLILINPVFQKLSKKTGKDTEGCLSVPGFYGTVPRYLEIYVSALNEKGKKIEFSAQDFFARVIQHEVDHLNGIMFIDRAKNLYQNEHKIHMEPEIVLRNIKKIK